MKLKPIVSIVKKSKTILLINGVHSQWVSNGEAIYSLHKFPPLTICDLLTIFDIPESKAMDYRMEEIDEPKNYNFYSEDDTEISPQPSFTFCYLGRKLKALKTSHGLAFIDENLLKPFAREEYKITERTDSSGHMYFAVKCDEVLQGIIRPFNVDKSFAKDLESLADAARLALKNGDVFK